MRAWHAACRPSPASPVSNQSAFVHLRCVCSPRLLLLRSPQLLAVGAASLWLWDTPVAQVAPRSLLSPLGGLLAFPRGSELAPFGVITLTPWLFVADSATKSLVRAVFPTPSAGSTGVAALDVEQLTREADAAGRIRPYSAAAAAASAAASTQG